MIQLTSQLSLLDTINENKVSKRQQQVLDLFELEGWFALNNRMIAEKLKLPINSITPRCKELRDSGLIIEHDKIRDEITGRLTIFWRLA